MKSLQQTILLAVSFAVLLGCNSNETDIGQSNNDREAKADIGATGYATILDAPPGPFMPVKPGEPRPKNAQQRKDDAQFIRTTKFQGSVMEEVNVLAETLRRNEAGNFVSLYFENEDDPSVVFQFLKDGPSTLRKYANHPRFFAKTVRWSEADLKAATDFMWTNFKDDRVLQSTGIGKNEVEARKSVSEKEFRALADRKGVIIPEAVELVFGSAPVDRLTIRPDRQARMFRQYRLKSLQ